MDQQPNIAGIRNFFTRLWTAQDEERAEKQSSQAPSPTCSKQRRMDEGKTDRKLNNNVVSHDDADVIEWPDWDDENDVGGGYGKKMKQTKITQYLKSQFGGRPPIGLQIDGTRGKQKKNSDRPTVVDMPSISTESTQDRGKRVPDRFNSNIGQDRGVDVGDEDSRPSNSKENQNSNKPDNMTSSDSEPVQFEWTLLNENHIKNIPLLKKRSNFNLKKKLKAV